MDTRAPGTSPTVNTPPQEGYGSIPALITQAAARYAEQDALVDGEVRWTFARLDREIARAARAAIAAGLAPGDRVAVWAPNCREWITAALGAVSVGAILVPLNTRYKGAEAADILRRSGARLLFTVRGFLGTDYPALLAGEELPLLERTVLLRGAADDAADPGPARADSYRPDSYRPDSYRAYLAAGDAVPDARRRERAAAVRPDDLSDILYTSGTTGRPKGVMCSHGQTLAVFQGWADAVGIREGDRYLLVNPFFHTFGYKAGVLACLLRGVTMVPEPVFDAGQALRRIAEERISVLMGPPTVFHSLLRHPDRAAHDLTSLRLAGTGAATIPTELVEQIRGELRIPRVFTAYGLSECVGVATICPPDADAATVAGTVGLPLRGTELRIVDAAGEPQPAGTAGEIVVRGYHVMRGYLDDPGASARAVDPAGWLHTGDVGLLDPRGHLVVTDRLKDMYIVGGFNVYPAEVERVLLGHPAIADTAVIGVPDERLGEVGAAYLVAAGAAVPEEAEVIAWARERLANFKVPRRVRVVAELPRNAGGKVLKARLRELEEQREE